MTESKFSKKRVREALSSRFIRYGSWLPDGIYLRILFLIEMGKWPHLRHPRTFNEKLQWLKLHNRKPEYTTMVDKYAAKAYVASVIGEEYVIPTLGVWDTPEEIEWDMLPKQFVLKTTHGGGNCGVVICRDKNTFDCQKAVARLRKAFGLNIYKNYREWPYKDVKPRVIAEKYIEPKPCVKDLPDYKWYCFNGEPKYCQVIQDRTTEETIDFYSINWERQKFTGLNPLAHPAELLVERPKNLEKQIDIARKLSKDIPFSRIDLYEVDGKTFFGEITFYPMGGMGKFSPEQYNDVFGKMLVLPGEKMGGVICKMLANNEIQINHPDLNDYKFFCFHGRCEFFKIDFDRTTDHHANYFDRECNLLPFGEKDLPPVFDKKLVIPAKLSLMVELAERLAKGIPFVRIDMYENKESVFWGEITFFPAGGFGQIEPEMWDLKLGKNIILRHE